MKTFALLALVAVASAARATTKETPAAFVGAVLQELGVSPASALECSRQLTRLDMSGLFQAVRKLDEASFTDNRPAMNDVQGMENGLREVAASVNSFAVALDRCTKTEKANMLWSDPCNSNCYDAIGERPTGTPAPGGPAYANCQDCCGAYGRLSCKLRDWTDDFLVAIQKKINYWITCYADWICDAVLGNGRERTVAGCPPATVNSAVLIELHNVAVAKKSGNDFEAGISFGRFLKNFGLQL